MDERLKKGDASVLAVPNEFREWVNSEATRLGMSRGAFIAENYLAWMYGEKKEPEVVSKEMSLREMAEALIEAMLPCGVKEFAHQIYEIDYPMEPHYFLMALILLAHEQGSFPLAPSMTSPLWDSDGAMRAKTFLCGGCGEMKDLKRIGQAYCSNECAARAKAS